MFDEFKAAFRSTAPWLAWSVITLTLVLSGPFGTYTRFGLGDRLVFWTLVVGGCILWGVTLRVLLMHRFRKIGFGLATLTATAISAPLLAVPIWALLRKMASTQSGLVPGIAELTLTIFVIGMGTGGLRWALEHSGPRGKTPAQGSGNAEGDPMPRLLSRIEPTKRGDMIRISARDHYLDVVTENGTTELLMRFSDALAELDGADGLQVHRSHWVAVPAVEGAERAGDKLHLVLRDGTRVPVSRKHRPQVVERGLV